MLQLWPDGTNFIISVVINKAVNSGAQKKKLKTFDTCQTQFLSKMFCINPALLQPFDSQFLLRSGHLNGYACRSELRSMWGSSNQEKFLLISWQESMILGQCYKVIIGIFFFFWRDVIFYFYFGFNTSVNDKHCECFWEKFLVAQASLGWSWTPDPSAFSAVSAGNTGVHHYAHDCWIFVLRQGLHVT